MISDHASERMQQRAIPVFVIEMYERFGSSMRHDGHDVLFMDKQARKKIAAAFGGQRACGVLEPWLNAFVRMDRGVVITVAHRTRRLLRDRKPRRT